MNWLKNLFREKKTIEQVNDWLVDEQTKLHEQQQKAITALEKDFPMVLTPVNDALAELEKAELRNPNIPERAKHYMTGNREQFVRLTIRFVESLFVPKESPDFSQLAILFDQYASNSARPAAILSEFFREEVSNVRKALSEIEQKLNELKKLQARKEQLGSIQDILNKMRMLGVERAETEKRKKDFEEQMRALSVKRDALRKEKEALTQRDDYKKVKEDILATVKERQDAERAITDLFQPLSDAIKKYAHKHEHAALVKYSEKPLEALIHDYSLSILKHVDSIRIELSQQQLDIREDKAQKALEAIVQLTKENLSAMIHRYANAKKRETDMHHDIAHRPVMAEYEQYAQQLQSLNKEIDSLQTEITKLALPSDEELRIQLSHALEEHKIALI